MKKHKRLTGIKEIFLEHLHTNFKEYIIAFAIFIIGIVLGMVFLNNLSIEQKTDMSQYFSSTISSLKENTQIDTLSLLNDSLKNNIFLCMLMWFAGSTIIGLPLVFGIVAFRGFLLGYTISAVTAILGTGNGMLFTITTMLLQNIIFIPCILALAVSSARLCKAILKDRRKETIKYGIIKHTIFSLIIGIMLIISSFIEVYISTTLFNISLNLY